MQALVKTPHININIKGKSIPEDLLGILKKKYGKQLQIISKADDEYINIFETEWFTRTNASINPGENMKIYREIHKITQSELGKKLGGIPRQHISNMEKGVRGISKETAKKLSELFAVPIDRFI